MSVFYINANNPVAMDGSNNNRVEDLAEAIEVIFTLDDENIMCMHWDKDNIYLTYKYDVGVIIEDLIFMIEILCTNNSGTEVISFGSSDFAARWKLKWDADDLNIEWHRACSRKPTNKPNLRISKKYFIIQWYYVLKNTLTSVKNSAIRIDNNNDVLDLAKLIKMIEVQTGTCK